MRQDRPLVLVIDDEEDTLALYRSQLARDGFAVETANDGLTGEKLARTIRPAIILLDLMLPFKSGFDLLKELRADTATKDIPILALTNLAEEVGHEQAIEMGAVGYIVKAERTPRQVSQLIRHVLQEGTGST